LQNCVHLAREVVASVEKNPALQFSQFHLPVTTYLPAGHVMAEQVLEPSELTNPEEHCEQTDSPAAE